MIRVGRFNRLEVVKKLPRGLQLDGGRAGEILLPKQYTREDMSIGDQLNVFIYLDSQDRLIATTETPLAQVDEFAYLRVAERTKIGVFLEWGLPKDLFVPFSEQSKPLDPGKKVLVRVYLDDTGRLAASTKLDGFLYDHADGFKTGDEVDLICADESDLGRKVIVNHTHWGLIYHNDIHKELRKGKRLTGFVKRLREDKKLEITLEKPGYGKVDSIAAKILKKLELEGGFLPLNDKSDPQLIKKAFGVSKNAFKQSIGALYKQRKIKIEKDGIHLVDE